MKEIIVDAKIENVPVVTSFIDEQLEMIDCPMKIQIQIDVAIDEIFSNIVFYAYPDRKGKATIQLSTDNGISLTFIDEGIPFNPLEEKDPDITSAIEEREVGGLGIFLVKKSMDSVTYKYEEGKNILMIKKELV